MDDFDDLFGDLLRESDGPVWHGPARCQLCGKFRRSNQMRMVYTGAPWPEPDYEACTVCLSKKAGPL